ncbi:MAG: N-6 DNA methylase [Elusimicrobiota bacterium]
MLNQETKRKIDSARDVLVGKVPDPKAQVEQITIALIYKFMDDIDKKSVEMGGKRKFFAGDYIKYSWTKLLDTKLGGQERLNLYSDGIEKMNFNKNIPQLFRDIFKGAFLPYRSPETLSLFLKEIDGLNYDHSEDLGDAYEYLLSCLQSQGDAGMFRTPRHIIDFIVKIVDPKKNETILDPACGTAGFLISTYKHIYNQNKKEKPGDKLKPDEKEKIVRNITGYDISPDMVRLSRVNMYLHHIPVPKIFEYDTLSSEEKWDESFDVILANPPFMTPRGGIKPHKRFSIQANRSEVLFVDYIMEHLNPNGRAGIIVPEGIIFIAQNIYIQLRKKLIEDGLIAVVSLPAGVFNPYAGVKTSILLFDNSLAKKSKEILFLKIGNDGYDLGAQRRPIDGNDLELALKIIEKYKNSIYENKKTFKLTDNEKIIALIVSKSKIAESGDYNFSSDRYKEAVNFINQKWPVVALADVCTISSGDSAPQSDEAFINGEIPFVRMKDLGLYHLTTSLVETNDRLNKNFVKQKGITIWPKGSILIPKSGSVYLNHRAILGINAAVVAHIAVLLNFIPNILNIYLYHVLKLIDIGKMASRTSGLDAISLTLLRQIKIPLPPLEIQKEIVRQIEIKRKAIDTAKEAIKRLEMERDVILANHLENKKK